MLIRQSKDYIGPNEGMEFNVPRQVFKQGRGIKIRSGKDKGGGWGVKRKGKGYLVMGQSIIDGQSKKWVVAGAWGHKPCVKGHSNERET
jgi:hypothetical protein